MVKMKMVWLLLLSVLYVHITRNKNTIRWHSSPKNLFLFIQKLIDLFVRVVEFSCQCHALALIWLLRFDIFFLLFVRKNCMRSRHADTTVHTPLHNRIIFGANKYFISLFFFSLFVSLFIFGNINTCEMDFSSGSCVRVICNLCICQTSNVEAK